MDSQSAEDSERCERKSSNKLLYIISGAGEPKCPKNGRMSKQNEQHFKKI